MRAFIAGLVLFAAPVVSFAEVVTFTNATGNGQWGAAGNWNPARLPTAADDVVIPAGLSVLLASGAEVGSIAAPGNVSIQEPLRIDGASVFGGTVELGATVSGAGNLTFTGAVNWSAGSLAGEGIIIAEAGALVRVVGSGQPTIAQVVEVFGVIEADAQVLRIARPQGLLRIPEGGVLRLVNGAELRADDVTDDSMVIAGALECAGGPLCRVNAMFISTGRVSAACPLVIAPPPSNLSSDLVLSGGEWSVQDVGSIQWSAQRPVHELGAGTTMVLSGASASPSLYGSLRRIDGDLIVDAKDPAVVISGGASNPTVIAGRVRVTGDSRISFSAGFALEPAARLELQASLVQPPITALNSVVPAATLGGSLEVLAPSVSPEWCGELIALITALGTTDPIVGDFSSFARPPLSEQQLFAYAPLIVAGDAIEAYALRADSPADWNHDGAVDSDDTIAFFADWDANNGDINSDGGSDSDDVITFFARWDAGC